jgi:3-isopropylmalate/(R)-2-methylmalate dehydratase small subunit
MAGRIENLTTGDSYACEPIPAHLAEMIRDGGLLPHLEKTRRAKRG